MDERELSERNKEARERAKAKREATSKIVACIINDQESFTSDVVEAAKILLPRKGGARGERLDSNKQLFLNMFEEKEIVHEDDVFSKLKLGRAEARAIRNELVKTLPQDRIWISFNRENGEYTIAGKGAEVPSSYDGYVPKDMTLLEEDDNEFDLLEDDINL